jgi:pimeloyl-ACP methyl ester carboxylesterase
LKNAFGTSSSAFVEASLHQLIAAARLPNSGDGISEIAVNSAMGLAWAAPQLDSEQFRTAPRTCRAATYSLARWLPLLTTVTTNSGKRPMFLGLFFAQPDDLPADEVGCALQDMLRSQAFLQTLDACSSYRTQEYQRHIPVTIAWGADDHVLIGPQQLRARRILPGAGHILLPRCGHVCMADDPDLVAATIDEAVLAAASQVRSRAWVEADWGTPTRRFIRATATTGWHRSAWVTIPQTEEPV